MSIISSDRPVRLCSASRRRPCTTSGGWLNLFPPAPACAGVQAGFSRNVLLLGLTSLFTDISSEMVVSVLPIYLVTFFRLSPVQFGLIDGLYQGVAALVQLASGIIAIGGRGSRRSPGPDMRARQCRDLAC